MNTASSLMQSLQSHRRLVEGVLAVAEGESLAWRSGGTADAASAIEARRRLLPQIDESLRQLKAGRQAWQRLSEDERAQNPEVTRLMQSTQDLLMKAILRDRENEQELMRRGQVPARHLAQATPPPKPHYVSELYRRHASSSSA